MTSHIEEVPNDSDIQGVPDDSDLQEVPDDSDIQEVPDDIERSDCDCVSSLSDLQEKALKY